MIVKRHEIVPPPVPEVDIIGLTREEALALRIILQHVRFPFNGFIGDVAARLSGELSAAGIKYAIDSQVQTSDHDVTVLYRVGSLPIRLEDLRKAR